MQKRAAIAAEIILHEKRADVCPFSSVINLVRYTAATFIVLAPPKKNLTFVAR
jgi:hypothetical protein